jgi:hypothetical protein
MLQTNRTRFNQNAVKPECQVCYSADETVEHFILHCRPLQHARGPVIDSINNHLQDSSMHRFKSSSDFLRLIIDFSSVLPLSMQATELCKRIEFDSYTNYTKRESLSI